MAMTELSINLNEKKRIGLRRINRYHVKPSVDYYILSTYPVFAYPVSHFDWQGDFVWAAWTGLDTVGADSLVNYPAPDPEFGRFVAVSSQNDFGFYSKYDVSTSDEFVADRDHYHTNTDTEWYQAIVFFDDRT